MLEWVGSGEEVETDENSRQTGITGCSSLSPKLTCWGHTEIDENDLKDMREQTSLFQKFKKFATKIQANQIN